MSYLVYERQCKPHAPDQVCHWAECQSRFRRGFRTIRAARAFVKRHAMRADIFRENLKSGMGILVDQEVKP